MTAITLPILLVEDDENDVFFFERALKKNAVTNPFRRVSDGDQALALLAGEGDYADRSRYPRPFLVVLDLNLPGRHGLEVLRWMRGRPDTRTTIVVVLTSSIDARDQHEAYHLGANSYIVKPADPNQLITVVAKLQAYWLELNAPPPLRESEERPLRA